jgi:flagellar biosynthesis/type III secretory pathway ATPase
MTLVNAKLIDTVKDLLAQFQEEEDFQRFGFYSKDEQQDLSNLVTKSSQALLSLIEGDPLNSIYESLVKHLDFIQIFLILNKEYREMKERLKVDSDDVDDIIDSI